MRHWSITIVLLVGVLACGDDESPAGPDGALYEITVPTGEGDRTFRVRIADDDEAAEAERLLTSGELRNISGELERGNGGFNAPYGWHLVPSSVHFADLTAEVCDGDPEDIDEDLSYWVDTVGQYCPWGVRVTRRLDD